jgi:hypothetical protein
MSKNASKSINVLTKFLFNTLIEENVACIRCSKYFSLLQSLLKCSEAYFSAQYLYLKLDNEENKINVRVSGKEEIRFLKVEPERTLEFSIALSFGNVETTENVDLELEYFGGSAETPIWVSIFTLQNTSNIINVELESKFSSIAYLERIEED